MNARIEHAAGIFVATILAVDGLIHTYWATGARWPADDSRTLSRVVLGADDVPFTASVVGPLAGLLLAGALIVVGHRYRHGRLGHLVPARVLQLGMLAITAGFATRALFGIGMALFGSTGTTFFWVNLFLYTPLCCVLALATIIAIRTSGSDVPQASR